MKPEWNMGIKEEVFKQLEVVFPVVTDYLEWLADIVPMPKKDWKVKMLVVYIGIQTKPVLKTISVTVH